LLVVLALCVLASASRTPIYTRTAAPKGWSLGSTANADATVTFSLALYQKNLDVLEKIAMGVSDPDSNDYQNFLTKEQIQAIVSPSAAVQDAVVSALVSAGVPIANIVNLGDSIDVKTTVAVASDFFQTQFFEFVSFDKKVTIVRQFGPYSLPTTVARLVQMVVGLSSFPIGHLNAKDHFYQTIKKGAMAELKAKKAKQPPTPNDDLGIVPATYFLMYQIPSESFANATSTSQGVIEFVGQSYSPTDLQAYADGNAIKITVPSAGTTVGPNDPTSPQIEAQLDIEAMACVNDEATNWFWLEAGSGWQYAFATHFVATAPNVPSVASISYAWSEQDQCNSGVGGAECSQLGVDTIGYTQRVNTEFQKIAALGVSMFSASGDSGANGRTDPSCTDSILHPDYPACSPWITSVGATQLMNAVPLTTQPAICAGSPCAATGTEVAVSFDVASFTSGGGFSWYAPMPAWQTTAVNAYLNSGVALPPSSFFNASGRGFPDIAAIGHNFLIIAGGSTQPVGGTSVSAPVVAALVGMLNQISVAKTGKTLGFISPLLYKMAAKDKTIFHDITVGDNKCTESGCSSSCQGFNAAPGWDPVTGLGSLNYQAAENYLLKMFADKKNKQ